MLVRRHVLLDTERDADLLAAIDGAANKTEAMRRWLRAGMQAAVPGRALGEGDLAAIAEAVRRAVRGELEGLRLQAPAPASAPEADEETRAKIRRLFASAQR